LYLSILKKKKKKKKKKKEVDKKPPKILHNLLFNLMSSENTSLSNDYKTWTVREWITEIIDMKQNGKSFNSPKNQEGWTILMCAIKYADIKIIQQILNAKDHKGNRLINIDAKDHNGNTALSIAVDTGDEKKILLLMTSGANIDLASTKCSNKARKKLKNLHINIQNANIEFIRTILMGNFERAKQLLENTPVEVNAIVSNPDQTLYYDTTALICAAKKGHMKLVELLLKHPYIDVNLRDFLGVPPLMYAVEKGYTKVVELFLKQPYIDVNIKNNDGVTALMWAAEGDLLKLWSYC